MNDTRRFTAPALRPLASRPRPCFPLRATTLLLASALLFPGVRGDDDAAARAPEPSAPLMRVRIPRGLPRPDLPPHGQAARAVVELGRKLFFEKKLSRSGQISCADCHNPALGWSDGRRVSRGHDGAEGERSAPSVVNAAYLKHLFWDGRAASLEQQAAGPITNPLEMAQPNLGAAVRILEQDAEYRAEFERAFGGVPTAERLLQAIADFERTLLAGNAPWDQFRLGDEAALSEAGQRGAALFFGKAHCSACHVGPTFSDGGFHHIGIGAGAGSDDHGRESVSGLSGDRGSFKTPSLRDVARTAPYMHDGSLATLADVIDYYDRGGNASDLLDEEIYPLRLSARERHDLLIFLTEGLTSDDYPE